MKPKWIWLFAAMSLLAGSCHADETVENLPTYQGRPVPPIDFDNLEYTHPQLKEKVHRLSSLVGGMHLPHEIPWSRRGPSKSDARDRHDYLTQWSTHKLGVTSSLQADQRPGMRVLMRLDVEPEGTRVWRFSLSTDWRPKEEGWNCHLSMHSWKPYRPDSIGAEKLTLSFRHTDGEARLFVPSSGWSTEVPADIEERKCVDGIPLRTTIHIFGRQQTTEQMQALVESPESFLAETLRALDVNEARVLAGIAASRHVYLSKRVRKDLRRDERKFGEPHPDEWEYEDVPTPDDFALTDGEKRVLATQAKAHFDQQRDLIKGNYEDMYPTMLKAFPINKYFVREEDAGSSAAD